MSIFLILTLIGSVSAKNIDILLSAEDELLATQREHLLSHNFHSGDGSIACCKN